MNEFIEGFKMFWNAIVTSTTSVYVFYGRMAKKFFGIFTPEALGIFAGILSLFVAIYVLAVIVKLICFLFEFYFVVI